jgi:hypothetical protein
MQVFLTSVRSSKPAEALRLSELALSLSSLLSSSTREEALPREEEEDRVREAPVELVRVSPPEGLRDTPSAGTGELQGDNPSRQHHPVAEAFAQPGGAMSTLQSSQKTPT